MGSPLGPFVARPTPFYVHFCNQKSRYLKIKMSSVRSHLLGLSTFLTWRFI